MARAGRGPPAANGQARKRALPMPSGIGKVGFVTTQSTKNYPHYEFDSERLWKRQIFRPESTAMSVMQPGVEHLP